MIEAKNDGFGLDKKARMDAKRRDKEEQDAESSELEPRFPYHVQPFDPAILET